MSFQVLSDRIVVYDDEILLTSWNTERQLGYARGNVLCFPVLVSLVSLRASSIYYTPPLGTRFAAEIVWTPKVLHAAKVRRLPESLAPEPPTPAEAYRKARTRLRAHQLVHHATTTRCLVNTTLRHPDGTSETHTFTIPAYKPSHQRFWRPAIIKHYQDTCSPGAHVVDMVFRPRSG